MFVCLALLGHSPLPLVQQVIALVYCVQLEVIPQRLGPHLQLLVHLVLLAHLLKCLASRVAFYAKLGKLHHPLVLNLTSAAIVLLVLTPK